MFENVLQFWFDEIEPKQWWVSDPAFDDLVRDRFAELLKQAAAGELYHWRENAPGRLAEIIVLDQFSRNVYRNTPRAFGQDGMALILAQEALALDVPQQLPAERIAFLIMPYMHSESAAIHEQALRLFEQLAPGNLDFERKHKAIVDRFGRYPHRNEILGRNSSLEEIEFLQQPGSSF